MMLVILSDRNPSPPIKYDIGFEFVVMHEGERFADSFIS